MNCAVHTDTPAGGYCRNCGKALCPQCSRGVKGAIYCEDCLAQRVNIPPARVPPGDTHAALAGALGFIPGLGAVYNGEYTKAVVQVLIFAGIIAALSQDLPTALYPLLGISLGVFYFYMPVDAYRTAKARDAERAVELRSQAVASVPGADVQGGAMAGTVAGATAGADTWEARRERHFNPIGAVILIGIGVLFLLGNFGLLREDWIDKGWPLILVVVGVGLLFRQLSSKA